MSEQSQCSQPCRVGCVLWPWRVDTHDRADQMSLEDILWTNLPRCRGAKQQDGWVELLLDDLCLLLAEHTILLWSGRYTLQVHLAKVSILWCSLNTIPMG